VTATHIIDNGWNCSRRDSGLQSSDSERDGLIDPEGQKSLDSFDGGRYVIAVFSKLLGATSDEGFGFTVVSQDTASSLPLTGTLAYFRSLAHE
jgi:hypothetical protein